MFLKSKKFWIISLTSAVDLKSFFWMSTKESQNTWTWHMIGGLFLWAHRWGNSAFIVAFLQFALYYFSFGMSTLNYRNCYNLRLKNYSWCPFPLVLHCFTQVTIQSCTWFWIFYMNSENDFYFYFYFLSSNNFIKHLEIVLCYRYLKWWRIF